MLPQRKQDMLQSWQEARQGVLRRIWRRLLQRKRALRSGQVQESLISGARLPRRLTWPKALPTLGGPRAP